MKIKTSVLSVLLFFIVSVAGAATTSTFTFRKGHTLTIACEETEEAVVKTALDIFMRDYYKVFTGKTMIERKKGDIFIGTLGLNSAAEKLLSKEDIENLSDKHEGFLIIQQNGKLLVLGSDKRGTAYGILEISRIIGVSPWEWWADSTPEPKEEIEIRNGFRSEQAPSVVHRGIFINDEDWGLTPWSYQTHEPSDIKGQIGPKTHARIFELLLRLRANTFWPAMHDCSVAFYLTPGNKEMADKYGIYIGTSHCEPMVRNTNAEWKQAGTGTYDYVNNRANVLKFWEERTTELAGSDNIYTLGIRGVHDSKMLGANTLEEQKEALIRILKDQRDMIARIVNPDVTKVSQVFIPYKEVLDVYNLGLKVPEDVSLIWCDDNYGYIRHFPDSTERARKGGNGIYYHASYWGRPHDYLWLATTHPALIYTQMKLAYDKGARNMWVLNVGDIKPAEYPIELFMDMAWDIHSIDNNRKGLDNHLSNWLSREFGKKNAEALLQIMNEYYRLAYIRKPEYMGNTRTEEQDPIYKQITDLPWSTEEIRERLNEYQAIADQVKALSPGIAPEKRNCWFELVEYPVCGAAEMNKKHLYGQLARHGKENWSRSDSAYNTIITLTQQYSSLANGKWNYMMDYQPRRLPVFDPVPHTTVTDPLPEHPSKPLYIFNGSEYTEFVGNKPLCHGLGYQREAINLPTGSSVTYLFETTNTGSIKAEVTLAPNHPVERKRIRYVISIDNNQEQTVDYHTEGRSEEWKLNVLRNQAIRITSHAISNTGKHTLRIAALNEGVVIDQIKLWD